MLKYCFQKCVFLFVKNQKNYKKYALEHTFFKLLVVNL